MEIVIANNPVELGRQAARRGGDLIKGAIRVKGFANMILATGTSQFEMLKVLVSLDIDWSKVRAFHLDEYIGLPADHPASFRKYLKERFVDIISPAAFHYIDGEADPARECRRLGELINHHPIDVAFVGIGENGHLAFNDPPADFETDKAYIVVELDEDCRKQQMGEGWFDSLEDVPKKAISMSIRQITKSRAIICSVPDKRKAEAVKKTLESAISPEVPASILRKHPQTWLYLDRNSASLTSSSV